jgi:hypothetical protein
LSFSRSKSGPNPPTTILPAQLAAASSASIDPMATATATTTPSRSRVSALPAQILSKVTDALSTFAHILSPAPPQFKPPPIDSAAAAAIVPGPASLTLTPQLTRKRSSSASAVRCVFGWFVYHCKHVSLASPLFLLSSIRVLIPCVQTINCCVRHALFARTFVLFCFTY